MVQQLSKKFLSSGTTPAGSATSAPAGVVVPPQPDRLPFGSTLAPIDSGWTTQPLGPPQPAGCLPAGLASPSSSTSVLVVVDDSVLSTQPLGPTQPAGSASPPSSMSALVGVHDSTQLLPPHQQIILTSVNPRSSMDMKYALMLFINILKRFVGGGDDRTWDAFGAMRTIWNASGINLVMLLIFIVCIEMILARYSWVEAQRLSASVFFSLFLPIVLPRLECWIYFVLLLLARNHGRFAVIKFKGFAQWLRDSGIPSTSDEVEIDEMIDLEAGGSTQAGDGERDG